MVVAVTAADIAAGEVRIQDPVSGEVTTVAVPAGASVGERIVVPSPVSTSAVGVGGSDAAPMVVAMEPLSGQEVVTQEGSLEALEVVDAVCLEGPELQRNEEEVAEVAAKIQADAEAEVARIVAEEQAAVLAAAEAEAAANAAAEAAAEDEAEAAAAAETERLAAEHAEQAEQDRIAEEVASAAAKAEEEAARVAAEAESTRIAAEEAEQERLAAEHAAAEQAEADRVAAEKQAEEDRVAAEAEAQAAQVAAEQEAAAKAKADADAAETAEAARIAIDEAAAKAQADAEAEAARIAAEEQTAVGLVAAEAEAAAKAAVEAEAAATAETERLTTEQASQLPIANAEKSDQVSAASPGEATQESAPPVEPAHVAEGLPPSSSVTQTSPEAGAGTTLYSDDVVYYHDGGKTKHEELADSWDGFDPNGSGSLDKDEVHTVLAAVGVDSGDDEITAAMKGLDKDGDGAISFDEFASWYLTYADESESQAETTVAGLAELVANGEVGDETYLWSAALGDEWVTHAEAKKLVGPLSECQPSSEDNTPKARSASPSMRMSSRDNTDAMAAESLRYHGTEIGEPTEKLTQDAPAVHSQPATMVEKTQPMERTVKHDAVVYYQDGGAAKTKEIEVLWAQVNVDDSGALDREEVQNMLTLLDMPVKEQDVDMAMKELDKDGDGSIDFDEFVTWYLHRNESGQQAVTTVAGLGDLIETGVIRPETYMWVESVGSGDWLTYADTKELLPTPRECRLAAAEASAEAEVAAAHRRARAMQIIGTLDNDGIVHYSFGPSVDGEDAPHAQTTVGKLHDLVITGDITEETMMWTEGMGETWLQYSTVKPLLPGPKAQDVLVTISYADGTERTATVGQVSELYASGEISDTTRIRVDGEEEFQTLADTRAHSPSPDGRDEMGATSIGAAMEQANAEAWEHTEVRRLQVTDDLKEAQTKLSGLHFGLMDAEADDDEERVAALNQQVTEQQDDIARLKDELNWLEAEIARISENLRRMFGEDAAKAFLRSRSLVMAVMHDDVLAEASKDMAAAAKSASDALSTTEQGQVDVGSLLGSAFGAIGGSTGEVGDLKKRARAVTMSLSNLSESHSDASMIVGVAHKGKNSSADGAAQLAKVQDQLKVLHSSGMTLSGGEDVSRVLAEHPDLLDDIKKLISIYVEDTVMGMSIPNIAGDKDWGRYSLENISIAKVQLPPQGLDLAIGTGVAVSIKGATAELGEFNWHYAKTNSFPKLKDSGNATASVSGLDIDVRFEIVADGTGGLALSNMLGNVQ